MRFKLLGTKLNRANANKIKVKKKKGSAFLARLETFFDETAKNVKKGDWRLPLLNFELSYCVLLLLL